MDEFVAEGRAEEAGSLPDQPSFAAFVRELAEWSQGRSLPDGWVPGTTLWMIDAERFIGKVEIRHRLTPALLMRGGHVGYLVRPTARGRGYGRAVLSLALRPCLDLGLRRILVTCDTTNEASRRVIESNGGSLEDVAHIPGRADGTMRYWIDVEAQLDRQ
jgi:predicted acetyltransferase